MTKSSRTVLAVLVGTSIAACTNSDDDNRPGDVSQAVYDRIAECGGGISRVIGGSITGKIANDLRSGNLSAEVRREILGAITNDPDIPADDKKAIYDRYTACLEQIRTGG